MSGTDYSKTITVEASAEEAYKVIALGFEFWWARPDQLVAKVGDKAKFAFPPGKGYWAFQAADLRPGQYVEMVCFEAHHPGDGMPEAIEKEWLGTKVMWYITETDGQSGIRFEHRGLTPDLHCYDVCTNGWDYFFVDTLKAYLIWIQVSAHRMGQKSAILFAPDSSVDTGTQSLSFKKI